MTHLDQLFSSELAQRLGWTIVHSLWQGALVAGILAAVLALLRRRSRKGNGPYLACGVALLAIVVMAVGTFIAVHGEPTKTGFAAGSLRSNADPAAPSPALGPDPMESAIPVRDDDPAPMPWRERFVAGMRHLLPCVTPFWMVGVVALALWRLGGLLAARRLRSLGTQAPGLAHLKLLDKLAARLLVARPVRMLESALVQTPLVVGWLRPVILLPVAICCELSLVEVEAIVAHELAHIRRHDYLVNLLQTVVETLFFHHPAVWWISRRMREERELCCDDMAVAVVGNALDYARALAAVEERRAAGDAGAPLGAATLALAPGRGSLLTRIRRIVGVDSDAAGSPARAWLTGALVAALMVSVIVAADNRMPSRAQLLPPRSVLLVQPADSRAFATGDQSGDDDPSMQVQAIQKPIETCELALWAPVRPVEGQGQQPQADQGFQPVVAQSGLSPERSFNAELPLGVWVQRAPGSSWEWLGTTPASAPLIIPECSAWAVEPLPNWDRDWAALVEVVNREQVPVLTAPPDTRDADVGPLMELHGIKYLYLTNTRVTDAGVAELRRALANCEITASQATAADGVTATAKPARIVTSAPKSAPGRHRLPPHTRRARR